MNANQIVSMIVRTVMRQLINRGVNAGFNQISRRGGSAKGQGPTAITPERRAQMQVRQARRAARAANR
ncbi:hypothetical protein [Ponticoccus alexandrii]|uniref:Uncharacterized protein n=1 Tax=Ponticoccus alexandrii TaxID=1943633 RepID=A0ABX7F996_9RHOB|nr:hypothetical protein [Ponticoccus alexandrii]ETA49945.1 hypothetical protein P279_22090 [Rhodobacteraceae bacterium PD-2]QRF66421.1 hypothetical protein GQA70_08905 [Ponticoccus alexandrii]